MNEGDIREDQTRAARAAEILNNEVFDRAMKALRDEVISQWIACPIRDQQGKEALWQLMKTTDKFEGVLRGYIETGKLATEQLNRFEKERGLRALLRRA